MGDYQITHRETDLQGRVVNIENNNSTLPGTSDTVVTTVEIMQGKRVECEQSYDDFGETACKILDSDILHLHELLGETVNVSTSVETDETFVIEDTTDTNDEKTRAFPFWLFLFGTESHEPETTETPHTTQDPVERAKERYVEGETDILDLEDELEDAIEAESVV